MKIFPGMHYTMGGLWVDYKQATNIPGVFAAGEAEYQYHGANRLGANSLVSCIYGGFVSGRRPCNMRRTCRPHPPMDISRASSKRQQEINDGLINADGTRIHS